MLDSYLLFKVHQSGALQSSIRISLRAKVVNTAEFSLYSKAWGRLHRSSRSFGCLQVELKLLPTLEALEVDAGYKFKAME